MSESTQEKRSAILAEVFEAMKNRGEKSVEEVCAEIIQKHGGNAEDTNDACKAIDRVNEECEKIKRETRGGDTLEVYLKKRLAKTTDDESKQKTILEKFKSVFGKIFEIVAKEENIEIKTEGEEK